MTQIEYAKHNKISPEMKHAAKQEGVSADILKKRVRNGSAVIIKNSKRKIKPCAVGTGLRTKVNANLGTSKDKAGLGAELKKLKIAVQYGADTVMDLSTGGNIKKIRRAILKNSRVPVGTVPVYQTAVKACRTKGHISRMTKADIMETLEGQAADGVDFFTLHCGVTQNTLSRLKRKKRLMPIVSRGGSFIAEWMLLNKKENPFYEHYDDILKIAKKYDIVLSLGDGMRPGALMDSTDRPQIQELILLGELAKKARENNVQVIIEGPGHIPLDEIQSNVVIQKKMCDNAPFYVLGPLVTDVAPGYDHIVGAIGGALAAFHGADFLCYVTPSEHLRIPDENDIKEGVIASRIAAHAADIAKRLPGALKWNSEISKHRSTRNWKGQIKKSMDPLKALNYRKSALPKNKDVCTMCSDFCSIKTMERHF